MPVRGEKRENGEGSKELGKKNYISVPQRENVDISADCVPFRPEVKPNNQLICMPRQVPVPGVETDGTGDIFAAYMSETKAYSELAS